MKWNATVLVTGVFDVLHVGHLDLLEFARGVGEDNCVFKRRVKVIVGINTDASVEKLGKGPDRPRNNNNARKRMLEALGYEVRLFQDPDASGLITQLHPDFWVKGPDYAGKVPVELAALAAYGGQFRTMPTYRNRVSTTSLLEKTK